MSSSGRPFGTLYSPLGYLFDDLSVPKYEHLTDNESDPDEFIERGPYTIDQVEQILGQSKLNKIFEKIKLP